MVQKLLKFNQLLRLYIFILLFLSLTNIDSARNESHHKEEKSAVSHVRIIGYALDKETDEYEFENIFFLIKAMRNACMYLLDVIEIKLIQ